ncbi:MAG: GNAT family N-acetyltransferase [Deltaproteobacteria bacterium]|nr:GNAT family N-acetyltransferase [Deltaproteobacteria bacterium]
MIRKCTESEFETIYRIINDAAEAYKGIIPEDRWHEPYMPREELEGEIRDGVVFWGLEEGGKLLGVMGIQDRGDVNLIRHSYVLQRAQKKGVGRKLLRYLEGMADKPVLIGTWESATSAVSFYQKNGYTLLPKEQKNRLIQKYWSIPERQIETSVVLADSKWMRVHSSL